MSRPRVIAYKLGVIRLHVLKQHRCAEFVGDICFGASTPHVLKPVNDCSEVVSATSWGLPCPHVLKCDECSGRGIAVDWGLQRPHVLKQHLERVLYSVVYWRLPCPMD